MSALLPGLVFAAAADGGYVLFDRGIAVMDDEFRLPVFAGSLEDCFAYLRNRFAPPAPAAPEPVMHVHGASEVAVLPPSLRRRFKPRRWSDTLADTLIRTKDELRPTLEVDCQCEGDEPCSLLSCFRKHREPSR